MNIFIGLKIKNHPFGKLRTRKSKIKSEYGKDYIEIDGQEYAMVKVPESQLPIELPYNVDYTPKGKPPLATDEKWLNVKNCQLCGQELDWSANKKYMHDNSPSIDRINNDNVITIDNIQLICVRCNTMKSHYTMNNFLMKCK